MKLYKTTAIGREEAHKYGWNQEQGTKEFLIEQAHQQLLVIFEDKPITTEDAKFCFTLPIPPPDNELKLETRRLFNYILENFDELLQQLLDKNYIALNK